MFSATGKPILQELALRLKGRGNVDRFEGFGGAGEAILASLWSFETCICASVGDL